MFDSNDIKLGVLQDLIEKMKDADGMKLKPKAVEISVSSMKPEVIDGKDLGIDHMGDEANEDPLKDLGLEGHDDGLEPSVEDLAKKEDDSNEELSPEDIAILEHLFSDKDEE